MTKRSLYLFVPLLLASFFLSGSLRAQDISSALQKRPVLSESQRIKLWDAIAEPMLIGFTTSSQRFYTDLPPSAHIQRTWKIKAWKNEKVHSQIVVASKVNIQHLRIAVGDLADANGNRIGKSSLMIGIVQNVMTDEFKDGCGHRTAGDFDSSLVPDIINFNLSEVSVLPNNTQAIWISISVPASTPAGRYQGQAVITTDKSRHILPIELSVVNRTLPSVENRSFKLDLWQHPAAIARIHKVALWSDAHFDLMRKYYTMLADAGQKFITAAIVDEPWNHQTYDDYPGLIKWIKKADGSWNYDYSLFDKYIDFVMNCGIKGMINCYSMVPWKIAFNYYDENLQKEVSFTHGIETPEYRAFWTTMLTDFTIHLKQKGWFDITAIAMDERPMEAMQTVIKLLKSIDPAWKIALAGNYHPEIEEDIFDYCVGAGQHFPTPILNQRKQRGQNSTWYTACGNKYPNLFTFSPPDEGVWIGWYSAAMDMDGYLRWAFNSWTADPLKDSRFTTWPAGDTYQIYPGPLTSIRFEKLIEGIQDFEKIKILKKLYRENNDSDKLTQLEDTLKTFRIDELSRHSAQQMIEKAQILLND